jgi:hypothetical protein
MQLPLSTEAVWKRGYDARAQAQIGRRPPLWGGEVDRQCEGAVSLDPHHLDQGCGSEELDRSLEVVGQNMQAHLRSNPRQRLRQEVS